MKKVKLNDLGRGVHFFLENFIEDKKIEFVILRHDTEAAENGAPDGYTLVEAAEDLFQDAFDKDGCNDCAGRVHVKVPVLPVLVSGQQGNGVHTGAVVLQAIIGGEVPLESDGGILQLGEVRQPRLHRRGRASGFVSQIWPLGICRGGGRGQGRADP